jgi:hypothetical protein
MKPACVTIFALFLLGAAAGPGHPAAQVQPSSVQAGAAVKTNIPYVDARPILEALRENLPADLTSKTPAELEAGWPGWVSRRNAEIRARLGRGDEDSIVYLWQYGSSFTTRPPLTARTLARLGGDASAAERILQERLEDLVAGIASPGQNERLRFAREVVGRKGINPTTSTGKDQLRRYLQEARTHVLAEFETNNRALASAKLVGDPRAALATYSTLFRDRGLSSDTSLLPALAIEQALEAIKSQGMLGAGSVRRVAIVGPGLDFANKDEAYDFYPQQTIQPFAIMDSVIRLGLAKPGALVVTTLDLSPRINQHIQAARERARGGGGYVLHAPLDGEERWNPEIMSYWQRLGDRIGKEVEPLAPPPGAGKIRVRAVRIPPAPVMSIVPRDLNIVLERLEPLTAESFDLIVATNILVYYEVFEQSLALVNVAKMLRAGGLFLSNTPVPPTAQMKLLDRYTTTIFNDREREFVFWYQRQ